MRRPRFHAASPSRRRQSRSQPAIPCDAMSDGSSLDAISRALYFTCGCVCVAVRISVSEVLHAPTLSITHSLAHSLTLLLSLNPSFPRNMLHCTM